MGTRPVYSLRHPPPKENRVTDHEAHHQAEQDRMREELDCLVVVHKHGLEGTAKKLATHMGLTKQLQQELDAHARTASVG